jgi:hypothetical protein
MIDYYGMNSPFCSACDKESCNCSPDNCTFCEESMSEENKFAPGMCYDCAEYIDDLNMGRVKETH